MLKQLTTGSINNQKLEFRETRGFGWPRAPSESRSGASKARDLVHGNKIKPLHSLDHYYLNQNNQFIIQLLISPL